MSNPTPILVSTVIADAIKIMPSIGNPSVSAANTYALALFNDVHNEILSKTQLLADSQVHTLTFIAGQGEYAIPAYIKKIWDVLIYKFAGDTGPIPLTFRSKDWLDSQRRGWAARTPVDYPPECYLNGTNFGLTPPPQSSSVGGYPLVQFRTMDGQTLATTDTLPNQVINDLAWVYGMCYRHAIGRRPDLVQMYAKQFEEQIQALLHDENARLERDKPAIRRWMPKISTT